uniref:Uncharacterized protein n=1 Tax=Kalanchoe fedtschenkoi TaxID=63787 RepID=A0A7N0V090_KALFE
MLESARVTNVQASTFECGGIAIACCLRHIYTDLNGVANFLKAWAAATFGDRSAVRAPNVTAPTLFPASPGETWIHDAVYAMRAPFAFAEEFARKRLFFNPDSVKKLQDEAVIDGEADRKPTRFESVSACLWRSFISASLINKRGDDSKPTVLFFPVNVRRREADLPLDEQSMGNIVLYNCAKQPDPELTTDSLSLSLLAQKIREGVRKVDSGVIARLRFEGSGALKLILDELSEELGGCGDMLLISSWCNFGLSDVNFGRGKPVWVVRVFCQFNVLASFLIKTTTPFGFFSILPFSLFTLANLT